MWNKSPLALSPLTFTLLPCSRLNENNGAALPAAHPCDPVSLGSQSPFQWCVNVGRLRCDLAGPLFVWMRSFSRDELSTQALEHAHGCNRQELEALFLEVSLTNDARQPAEEKFCVKYVNQCSY